jgi:hypothetical protein
LSSTSDNTLFLLIELNTKTHSTDRDSPASMTGMVPATPTLMGIPRELRDRIYEFVWCSPGCARLTQEYIMSQMRDPSARTYPEAVAFPYPPKQPTEKSAADSENEDDWEDELEDCFSASEEDEV